MSPETETAVAGILLAATLLVILAAGYVTLTVLTWLFDQNGDTNSNDKEK